MDSDDLLVSTTKSRPVSNLTKEDISKLCLSHLGITTKIVVSRNNGTTSHGNMNHRQFLLLITHSTIRGTEVNSLSMILTNTSTRTNCLIVDLVTSLLCHSLEPGVIQGSRESSTCSIQCKGCFLCATAGNHQRGGSNNCCKCFEFHYRLSELVLGANFKLPIAGIIFSPLMFKLCLCRI